PAGGVAVDQTGGRLLWFDWATVNAVPLAGGPTTTLFACCDLSDQLHVPRILEDGDAIAVDDVNGRLYFNGGDGGLTVGSVPLDGSGPSDYLYGNIDTAGGGVAVDRGFVYWTTQNEGPYPEGLRIQRAPIDGSGPVE